MTKQQVLEETVELILEQGSRCISDHVCLYAHGELRCAVGFWLKDARAFQEKFLETEVGEFQRRPGLSPDLFLEHLKEEVSHITDLQFWIELQDLHDVNQNWVTTPTELSLSYHGDRELKSLLEEYKDE